jgi:hypothetical protein
MDETIICQQSWIQTSTSRLKVGHALWQLCSTQFFSSIFIFQRSGEFSLKTHSLPKIFSKTNLQNNKNALPKKSLVQQLCHINLISFISSLILNDQPLAINLLHSYCKHYCVWSYFPFLIIVGVSPTCEPCYE